MFFSMINGILLAAGWILLGIWLFLYLKGKKYEAMFENLEEEKAPFKEIYGVGYAFTELVHYQYKSEHDRKMRPILGILYPEKYVEYYLRVVYAQQISIGFTIAVLGFALYGLSGELGIVFIFLMFAGLAVYYFGNLPEKKIEKRSEEMMGDFSEVVSNLALLTNAGLILKEAWREVAFSGEGCLYEEMQKVVEEMDNGISEGIALYRFGIRCVVPPIKKFSSIMIQGIEKGNRELVNVLQEQSAILWTEKKQQVRRQGEKAANRLMIPIFIMFAGILVMIVVPIFTNMF
ncbi:MAG: type II secretion system F family protein [Lachnospiraceae bacterium]|nr:type II secretion system F family protein [Lachnospiraceae bacterium]